MKYNARETDIKTEIPKESTIKSLYS